MQLTRLMVPASKYNIKCPYSMNADGICVHNTANKASAMSEISYMVGNNNQVSYHYAVDDYRIVQGVEENRNAWHAGDGSKGKGNRNKIAIEICHSTNPDVSVFTKSELLAAKFIAYKLKEKGWRIEKVTKHQDYSGKYCPHKTLDLGWQRFINLIKAEMGQTIESTAETQPKPAETIAEKIDVKYQVYANGKWLEDVVNFGDGADGYAGIYGKAISGLRANTVGKEDDVGKLIYKVHTLNGRWLDEVTDREKDKNGDNYAGILGKAIDGVMIKSTKGKARYRVHLINGSWLPWVTGYNINDSINGYAGNLGHAIDGIQIEII